MTLKVKKSNNPIVSVTFIEEGGNVSTTTPGAQQNENPRNNVFNVKITGTLKFLVLI